MSDGVPQTFYGLCVGGPANGRMAASPHNTYRVLMPIDPLSEAAFWSPDDPPENTACKTFVYKLVTGLRGQIVIDFWVPIGIEHEPHMTEGSWALGEIIRQFQTLNAAARRN